MSSNAPTVPTSGNTTRRFADPFPLAGTTLWHDQVVPTIDAIAGRSDAEIRLVAPRFGPPDSDGFLWLDPQDVRGRLLTDPDVPAVLVLDRYAAAQEAFIADGHRLPGSDQVIATLAHLSMQCPECSV